MPTFKEPLSKSPNNLMSERFKGADEADLGSLANDLIEKVPSILLDDYGFKTVGTTETITVGGLFNKKDYPGVMFRFPEHREYSGFLVSLSKVGSVLEIDVVSYGTVSKNMQHSNMSREDTGFSLGGLAKQAFHSAMTDTSAVEEEEMHYQGLLDAITQTVQSWRA